MQIGIEGRKNLGTKFVLLAPVHGRMGTTKNVVRKTSLHQKFLAGAQQLRGRIYVADGAVRDCDLTSDGRHLHSADEISWHLLTVDAWDRVTSCLRYFAHDSRVSFAELAISRSGIAQSEEVRQSIQAELDLANRRGFSYVELGGWAISESLRCTTQAISTLVTVYALSQMLGGAQGLSTATTRHHSSSILKRMGGAALSCRGKEISPYYDPQYGCEMELLRFDSTSPNARYEGWIRECNSALREVPVITQERMDLRSADLREWGGVFSDTINTPGELAFT
jgi:hypothetical protein